MLDISKTPRVYPHYLFFYSRKALKTEPLDHTTKFEVDGDVVEQKSTIVGTINEELPGDKPVGFGTWVFPEKLTRDRQVIALEGPDNPSEPEEVFFALATEIRQSFKRSSDLYWDTLPRELRQVGRLVTIVFDPISTFAKDVRGFDVRCEFFQTVRLGDVASDRFELASDKGEYPIHPPTPLEMSMLVKEASQILPPERERN